MKEQIIAILFVVLLIVGSTQFSSFLCAPCPECECHQCLGAEFWSPICQAQLFACETTGCAIADTECGVAYAGCRASAQILTLVSAAVGIIIIGVNLFRLSKK